MNSKKVWIEGCALGVLLSLLSVVLLDISDVTLLGAYTLVLLLVSASLTSSQRDGAFFGLFAVIAESVTDFVYYLFGYGVQASLVPYAVGFILFVGRIPLFPLMGAIGGYLGQRYFAEKTKPRARAPGRAFVGRKTKGKEGRSGERNKERED
jgi:hypothetical protein